ncbi:hypothetical protein J3E69DRAFT_87891 [Trichoderma sp. SZMC 28015]
MLVVSMDISPISTMHLHIAVIEKHSSCVTLQYNTIHLISYYSTSTYPSLSMYSRSHCIKGKPPAPSMPLSPTRLDNKYELTKLRVTEFQPPKLLGRYLQRMQTEIPAFDMKLIITNRTSSFPVISLLYFCFLFVFGGSQYGINHRIISSLDECNPTGCPTLHVQAELYHEQHDHFQLNILHPTIPFIASPTPISSRSYAQLHQQDPEKYNGNYCSCRYPSRWQSLPHLCVVVVFRSLKPYSIPLSLHRITSIPSASWRL